MENWDESMQIECASSFSNGEVVKCLNQTNIAKLMDECLNIILNANIENDDVSLKFILV